MLIHATDGGVGTWFVPFILDRIDLIAHQFVDGERVALPWPVRTTGNGVLSTSQKIDRSPRIQSNERVAACPGRAVRGRGWLLRRTERLHCLDDCSCRGDLARSTLDRLIVAAP